MHNIHCTFFLHDRQFAKVAESIIVKQNGMDKHTCIAKYFPDFIWLLRDVRLIPAVNGKNVSTKDYIKTTVFGCANEDPVGKAIMTIFPSFDAVEIRPPNDSDLFESCQETLTSKFHKQVEDFVHHLHEFVKPKQGFDGPLLAEMADKYVAVVNDPDATPCISDMCMEGIANSKIKQLAMEYDREISAAIHMPIESTTIIGVHNRILAMKKTALIKEVQCYLSSSRLEQTIKELEDKIAMFEGSDPKKVVGGILKKYTDQNYEKSKEHCKTVFDKLYKRIKEKTDRDQYGEYTMGMMSHDLQDLEKEYYKSVVGPAQWDVYEEKKEYIQSKKEAYRNILDRKKQECEVKRMKKIDQLVEEYDHEVGAAISKLGMPIEESCKQDEDVENPTTLLGVHHKILKMKKTALINEVRRYLTSSCLDQTIKDLEKKIATFEGSNPKKIVGGILKNYADQNYKKSVQYCRTVFDSDEMYKPIKKKVEDDLQLGHYTTEEMSKDLEDLKKRYRKRIVGPAREDVYNEKQKYMMEEIEKKKQHMAKGECYISEADSVLVIPGCGLNIRKNIPEIVERMVL